MNAKGAVLPAALSLLISLGACSGSERAGGGRPTRPPGPTGSGSGTETSSPNTAALEGIYVTTVTRRDTDRSPDGHIVNLGTLLVGRYRLTLRDGNYEVTLDGRTSVPTPSPRRTGGEGAYATFGFWIFLGVPPIGRGTYTMTGARVVFQSDRGACFQKGAGTALRSGTYRWKLGGGDLVLRAGGPDAAPSADGCLGRRFVLTSHPWSRLG
jgi:hypothetical protein